MYHVVINVKPKRGCGYRNPSNDGVGIYLMSYPFREHCDRLPFPLHLCPTCNQGSKFTRAFTWIDHQEIFNPSIEPYCKKSYIDHDHIRCPACFPEYKVTKMEGLLWV